MDDTSLRRGIPIDIIEQANRIEQKKIFINHTGAKMTFNV